MDPGLSVAALLAWIGATQPHAASLPRTEGELVVPGLVAEVEVARDDLGIPVIRGSTFHDVIRAEGFVHAQDRFFQMDVARRLAAGRLAEVVGAAAVPFDERFRRYRFERVADAILQRLADDERRALEIYCEGVNAGLADLAVAPPEYLLLLARPEPWRPRDSILVVLAMFDVLNFNAVVERRLGVMKSALPPELLAFLTPLDTRFEAPILGASRRSEPLPLPGPDVVDLRRREHGAVHPGLVETPQPVVGSNSWAVAGRRTSHGGAILANDPHLQITVPGIWYRAELKWGAHHAIGLSLPGNPGIVIGSNGRVAWGFTNTMADFQDLIVIDRVPDDPDRYRTPDGVAAFEAIEETIRVRRGTNRTLALRGTTWGVVVDEDHQGRSLVLKWTALDPAMINLRLLDLMTATTLEEAVAIARQWYGPSQNALLADDRGRIAWVVTGYLPRRIGFDGSVPVSWADGQARWEGAIDERHRPMLIDPEEGMLYTANNRTVNLAWASRLGNGWDLGTRAKRIRDLLQGSRGLDERDLHAMQLDTRTEIFDFYRDLFLGLVDDDEVDPRRRQARAAVLAWDGTAGADQPGLCVLDAFRDGVHDALIGPLVTPCREVERGFRYVWLRSEEVVRRLLETRPDHLRPPGQSSWDGVLQSTIDRVLARLAARSPEQALAVPWGDVNRAVVRHPLARAVPALGPMLNLPEHPQAGHRFAIRVASPAYGASARLVVSPGREDQGVLHIPAGQSGHPLSPHYRDSHPAWAAGLPTPLRSGPPRSRLRLVPDA